MRVMLSVIKTVKKYVAEDDLHSSSRSFLCENGPGVPDNLCRAILRMRKLELECIWKPQEIVKGIKKNSS